MNSKILLLILYSIILNILPLQVVAEGYSCGYSCTLSEDGFKFIKRWEGYMPFVYEDAGGRQTIGFGHLMKPGDRIAQPLIGDEAHRLLEKDVAEAERAMKRNLFVPFVQGQWDALTSWTFNLGEKALRTSQLREYANMELHNRVPNQIRRWVFVKKERLRGLIARRNEEAVMYEEATR